MAIHVLDTWKEILEAHQPHFDKVLPALAHLMSLIRSQQEGPGSPLQEETFKKLRRLITKFLHQFMKPTSLFPLHEAFSYNQMRPLQEVMTSLHFLVTQCGNRPSLLSYKLLFDKVWPIQSFIWERSLLIRSQTLVWHSLSMKRKGKGLICTIGTFNLRMPAQRERSRMIQRSKQPIDWWMATHVLVVEPAI